MQQLGSLQAASSISLTSAPGNSQYLTSVVSMQDLVNGVLQQLFLDCKPVC